MDQNTSNEKNETTDQLLEDMLLHDFDMFEEYFLSPCFDSYPEETHLINNSNLSSTLAVDHQHSNATISVTNNIVDRVNFNNIKQGAPTTESLLANNNNDSSSSTNAAFIQEENQQQLSDERYYDDIFLDFDDLFPEGLDLDFDLETNTNNIDGGNKTKGNTVGFGFKNQINHHGYYYHHSYMAPRRVHFFKAVAPDPSEPVNGWRICKGRRRKGRKPIESLLIFNKQQQRINNRISTAKSIAKKQAHLKYLEEEVVRLRSENEKEKKLLKFLERSLEIPLSKRSLARTASAPTIQFEG